MPSWIGPAFQILVQQLLDWFSVQDANNLGTQVYYTLTKVKFNIKTHCQYLAFQAPPIMHSVICTTKPNCVHAWSEAWFDGPMRMLMHPDCPQSGIKVLEALANAAGRIKGLCDPCHSRSVVAIRESGALTEERNIIEGAIQKLEQDYHYYTS